MNDEIVSLTLSQFGLALRRLVSEAQLSAWVVAEIHSISISQHCYIECIENSPETGKPIAKMRFNIWASNARAILSRFEAETGQQLKAGMKIMAFVTATYSECYGMSATVSAINSEFTLGDLELQRRATIERLMADGIFDINKSLELPTAIERVAVISSETAAGYGDFCNQIAGNPYGLHFDLKFYPALVQGNDAPASIIAALDAIASDGELPDVVVIIRGGGSRSDLLCFDDYELCANVAQFPVPVIAGIGHERDTSVCDMVAHTRVKTPTAAAEFLVAHNYDLLCYLEELIAKVRNVAQDRISRELNGISQRMMMLRMASSRIVDAKMSAIQERRLRLKNYVESYLVAEQQRIESLRKMSVALNPTDTFNRGFTMTFAEGRRITKASDVKSGDELTTYTSDGEIHSVVI